MYVLCLIYSLLCPDHSVVDDVADSVFSTAVVESFEEEDEEDPPNANTNPSGLELLNIMEQLDDDSDSSGN